MQPGWGLAGVRFSIVTPSFRSSRWLQLCVASVADQGVELDHIVQDSCSDDGTLDWLPSDPRVSAFVEKDQGMYDAINRGLRRANGDLLAYLNCDEQYLPGALRAVREFFGAHPEVDVVFGDVVLVGADGGYLAHRKVRAPAKYHTWTCHLATLSCGTFFRKRIITDGKFFFDARLRDVGDGEWMVRMLRGGVKMAALGRFTSVFTKTGANMSAGPNALRENRELRESAPGWAQQLRPWWILQHRLRKVLTGAYRQQPFHYEVYTLESPDRRQLFQVTKPNFRWPS